MLSNGECEAIETEAAAGEKEAESKEHIKEHSTAQISDSSSEQQAPNRDEERGRTRTKCKRGSNSNLSQEEGFIISYHKLATSC